jgi:hypothetical protein
MLSTPKLRRVSVFYNTFVMMDHAFRFVSLSHQLFACFFQRNSDYTEFRFTTVGSNWPDYAAEKEAPTAVTETKAKRWRAPRIKPLQRLGNLIRRRT